MKLVSKAWTEYYKKFLGFGSISHRQVTLVVALHRRYTRWLGNWSASTKKHLSTAFLWFWVNLNCLLVNFGQMVDWVQLANLVGYFLGVGGRGVGAVHFTKQHFSRKFILQTFGSTWIDPRTTGWEAETLPLCHPPSPHWLVKTRKFYLLAT